MDGKCVGPSCLNLETQSFADANACVVSKKVNENTEGCKLCLVISYKDGSNRSLIGMAELPGQESMPMRS